MSAFASFMCLFARGQGFQPLPPPTTWSQVVGYANGLLAPASVMIAACEGRACRLPV